MPSNIRGDGMSANDLQRMLSRQTIAPENIADTQADIQKLQQASVARQAINDQPPPMPPPTVSTPVGPFGNPLGEPRPIYAPDPMNQPFTQQPMNQPFMQQPQFGMPQQMPQSQFGYGFDSTLYKGSGGIGNLAPAQQFGLQQQNMGGLGSPQPTANVLF
tara:strand:+ start:142 stop:621 length:480 start_codon:yes stop_codon:yes gene_type:complete